MPLVSYSVWNNFDSPATLRSLYGYLRDAWGPSRAAAGDHVVLRIKLEYPNTSHEPWFHAAHSARYIFFIVSLILPFLPLFFLLHCLFPSTLFAKCMSIPWGLMSWLVKLSWNQWAFYWYVVKTIIMKYCEVESAQWSPGIGLCSLTLIRNKGKACSLSQDSLLYILLNFSAWLGASLPPGSILTLFALFI